MHTNGDKIKTAAGIIFIINIILIVFSAVAYTLNQQYINLFMLLLVLAVSLLSAYVLYLIMHGLGEAVQNSYKILYYSKTCMEMLEKMQENKKPIQTKPVATQGTITRNPTDDPLFGFVACPSCGSDNPKDQFYCISCGAKLPHQK